MEDLYIDGHAFKHGLSEADIAWAWEHFIAMQFRGAPNEGEVVAVGPGGHGQLIQLVGVQRPYGTLIFHAMVPPTENVITELGLA